MALRCIGDGLWQGRGGRSWRRRAAAAAAALLLGWAALSHGPAQARHDVHFRALQPTALAHYIADFSNYALLNAHNIRSWTIESEWSNYTWWRYAARYACGAACGGRAHVSARGEPGARHHRVLVVDARCARLLPLLPWPFLCEETEMEMEIVGEELQGGEVGSRLTESAVRRCSLLATLLTRCASAAQLNERRQLHLRLLSAALA